ncbi:MAG: NACHT domain-containing protein [Candidatus Dadabacteria bacterium]|nr:NACHT domain-containing protein [Candidatus Dadabacteria bacterium]
MNKKTKGDHGFKKTGITRIGSEYQDLIGIELLIQFFRDPEKYHWIELDSENPDAGYLDDVVAARQDGTYEFIQVKFTVDPNKHFLDWNWLLKSRPRGTSLLAKWAESLNRVEALGPIHSAKLRTNRKPAGEFKKALEGERINLSKLGETTRNRIEDELGGVELAFRFFDRFGFSHSEPLIDQLENQLKASVVPTDTDNGGWYFFLNQVQRWATRKRNPEPDGRIKHQHLVQVITKKRAQPIPQNFRIPDVYCLPSSQFHADSLERVKMSERQISVLWGTPGRGKSTYLSFFIEELHRIEIPTVRHHYFMSLDDTSSDRFSFFDIATSLMDQMVASSPEAVRGLQDGSDQLRSWVEACGNYFEKKKKPFVIVVDGLDHVWREQGNITQMEQLFNYLLPVPPNVHLVIGTQKVSQNQLPHRLIQHAEDDDWIEIPPMDEQAVRKWVIGQREADRLRFPDNFELFQPERKQELIDNISLAFFEISQGHPLHLIYSFEALVGRGVIFTPEEIRLLPTCPEGDIRKYYKGLWSRLSAEGRQIIHLIAGSDFHWPQSGIIQCVGPIEEINHLLEYRRSDVVPFHGSIIAYAKERFDHEETFQAILPKVINWLEQDAPEYWRWGWLWLMRAKQGDYADLLNKTTREWVLKSLASGWPDRQIVTILDEAEKKSFAELNYAKTIELRSLKTRLYNGFEIEYQTDSVSEFLECAIRSSGNTQRIINLADSVASLADKHVVALACSAADEMNNVRGECVEELRRRIDLWISLRHRSGNDFLGLVRCFFDALSLASEIDTESLLKFVDRFNNPKEIFGFLMKSLSRERRLNELISIAKARRLKSKKALSLLPLVQDTIVRVASAEGVCIASRYAPTKTPLSPLMACWMHYHQVVKLAPIAVPDVPEDIVREYYSHENGQDLEQFFYSFFFYAFANNLRNNYDNSLWPTGERPGSSGWIDHPLRLFEEMAQNIATGNIVISFSTPYHVAKALEPVAHKFSDASYAQYKAFKSALLKIAIDLHCVNSPVGRTSFIGARELAVARSSVHWNEEMWISIQVKNQLSILDPEAARWTLKSAIKKQDLAVTRFDMRADKWVELAQFALLYDLQDSRQLVSRATNCIIGYGWRKDLWLVEILDSVAAVHDSGAKNGFSWLQTLVPIVGEVTKFTDGDETDYIRSKLINVVAEVCPNRLPQLYAYHIANDEFRYAEETISAYCKLIDFTDPTSVALAHTFVEEQDILNLRSLREADNADVGALENEQIHFVGGIKPKQPLPENKDEELDWAGTPPDVSKFKPSQFRILIEKASSHSLVYKLERKVLKDWLDYWKSKDKGLEAIASIRSYFNEEENPRAAESLLDEVFQVSLELEGKTTAYEWLVLAHIHRHGWSSYWGPEDETLRRIGWAAEYYRNKWVDYILDTSKPSRYRERRKDDFSIGIKYLVKFLLLVDQKEIAVDFVDMCVRIVAEEVSDQPIQECPWFL